jgi:hypothetical protein
MRFASKDIYVEQEGRRFVAAFAGDPIPAHLDHLVDSADTTDTPPETPAASGPVGDTAPAPGTGQAATIKGVDNERLLDHLVEVVREVDSRDIAEEVIESKVAALESVLRPLPGSDDEVEVPADVVPGETPGWPIDPETEEVYDLPESVREELANLGGEKLDYATLDKDVLQDLIERKVKRLVDIDGSGKGGNVVKDDLVRALEEADALEVEGE